MAARLVPLRRLQRLQAKPGCRGDRRRRAGGGRRVRGVNGSALTFDTDPSLRVPCRSLGNSCPGAARTAPPPGNHGAHLTFLHRRCQPGRAKDNSPAFQRWDTGPGWPQVPSGTAEGPFRRLVTLSSLPGLIASARLPPSVESLGYSLSPGWAEGRERVSPHF
jgi:hypothetical protein